MIRITSKIDGFRRAGVAHSATPTDYPNDFFKPGQLAALEAEPNLVVQQLPDTKDKDAGKKEATK